MGETLKVGDRVVTLCELVGLGPRGRLGTVEEVGPARVRWDARQGWPKEGSTLFDGRWMAKVEAFAVGDEVEASEVITLTSGRTLGRGQRLRVDDTKPDVATLLVEVVGDRPRFWCQVNAWSVRKVEG